MIHLGTDSVSLFPDVFSWLQDEIPFDLKSDLMISCGTAFHVLRLLNVLISEAQSRNSATAKRNVTLLLLTPEFYCLNKTEKSS